MNPISKLNDDIVEEFEYKGKKINVQQDAEKRLYLIFKQKEVETKVYMDELKDFIKKPFSHGTINNNKVDVIEKSLKINGFIYNWEDLKDKLDKYDKKL